MNQRLKSLLIITKTTQHILVMTLSLFSICGFAELRDPTQIPAMLINSIDENGQPVVENNGPVLQSIIMNKTQPAVVINGQYIKQGERYQDAKLVNITDSTATLRDRNGRISILKMGLADIKQESKQRLANEKGQQRQKSINQTAKPSGISSNVTSTIVAK